MAYGKTTWTDGLPISVTRLNNLETQYDQILSTAGIIGTTPLADGAVTTAKLAANAVTQAIRTEVTSSFTITNSTTYADVTPLNISITTSGGPLLIILAGGRLYSQSSTGNFVITVNGVDYAVADAPTSGGVPYGACVLLVPLPAGSYTVKLRGRQPSASGPTHYTVAEVYSGAKPSLTVIELKR